MGYKLVYQAMRDRIYAMVCPSTPMEVGRAERRAHQYWRFERAYFVDFSGEEIELWELDEEDGFSDW